jgi:hypothetical protein
MYMAGVVARPRRDVSVAQLRVAESQLHHEMAEKIRGAVVAVPSSAVVFMKSSSCEPLWE